MSDLDLKTIRDICQQTDLKTSDPYDIWTTPIGFKVKSAFNRYPRAAIVPSVLLTVFDTYINNNARYFYHQREYPIVRAWAALTLLNLRGAHPRDDDLALVRQHLDWLQEHTCKGYSGPCWGLAFEYAVSEKFQYDSNMPLSTMTPYALEAFVRYTKETGDERYKNTILGIHQFLDNDLRIMKETDDYLVTSYAAMRDRRVTNAVSYVMYCYAILLDYLAPDERARAETRIQKLYTYVARNQRPDGSWLYSAEGHSFVDCFHSCIVIKNLLKTNAIFPSTERQERIKRGYEYIKKSMYVRKHKLFKRFAIRNKPGLVKFDLYDNAEMLNLAHMVGDHGLVDTLKESISRHFVRNGKVYSQIDWFGRVHNSDMLRWAVMPYFYALTVTWVQRNQGEIAAGESAPDLQIAKMGS